jgi:hypothetical protein
MGDTSWVECEHANIAKMRIQLILSRVRALSLSRPPRPTHPPPSDLSGAFASLSLCAPVRGCLQPWARAEQKRVKKEEQSPGQDPDQ